VSVKELLGSGNAAAAALGLADRVKEVPASRRLGGPMFDSVTIDSSHLNAGSVAEALIYYGEVTVSVGGGALVQFVREFGSGNLMRAIGMGALHITFDRHGYAVTTANNPFRVHDFGGVSLVKTADGRAINSAWDEIDHLFQQEFGSTPQSRRLARDIADRVQLRDFNADIPQLAKRDALDRVFMTNAVRAWLQVMVPEYEVPKGFQIDTMDTGKGLVFLSNLDFEQINKFYHRRIPATHSSVSPDYLLAHVATVRREIALGADMNSDLWLGPGEAAMMRIRMNALAERATQSRTSIAKFHEIEFNGRTFREAVKSGEKTPCDVLDLLDNEETKKFKAWLSLQSPDARLIKEYDRAVFSKTGWAQRLPFRVGKIFVFAGIGVGVDAVLGTMGLATLATSALSAGSDVIASASDEFVLSKWLQAGSQINSLKDQQNNF